jgi:hypothetical protein
MIIILILIVKIKFLLLHDPQRKKNVLCHNMVKNYIEKYIPLYWMQQNLFPPSPNFREDYQKLGITH